jgi:DNA helicase-2/ATP-dependent DNA helicase PcrA
LLFLFVHHSFVSFPSPLLLLSQNTTRLLLVISLRIPWALRKPFEPDARIPYFDLQRLYYVAFSRAKGLLILMAVRCPGKALTPLWSQIPAWSPNKIKNMPAAEPWEEAILPRPHYGFTNDIQLYTTCPHQYQFFRSYNFAAAQNKIYFAGQLVHRTLEHIHRMARDKRLEELNEKTLERIFERKFRALTQSYLSAIESNQKTRAWQQVLRYFQQNREMLRMIEAAELPVQIEKSAYVLTGKIDLLVKNASSIDLIDFKTQPRPKDASVLLGAYEQQLHFYAHALEQSYSQRPERLFLYWTAEERRENALMEIPYQEERMKKINTHLEDVVEHIEKKQFHVRQPPALEICRKCDLRALCQQDRVINI